MKPKSFQERLDRRRFFRSAAGAGLALSAAVNPLPSRNLPPEGELRVGLMGSDGHTSILLNSLPRIPGARLVAVARSRPQDDEGSFRRHPAFSRDTRLYSDYRELLEKEDLHVVGVCLPYYQNAQASAEAARRGIHVVSEKPAATTLEDLEGLSQAIQEGGIRYSIMLNMRTLPALRAARQAVARGWVGEPVLVSSQKSYKFGDSRPWFYRERRTYGGTIPWVGIHAIDYMRWVSGLEYRQVAACHGNKSLNRYPGCEDHAGILFRLSNAGTALCHLDYLRPGTAPTHGDDRLRIAGTEGVLELVEDGKRALLTAAGRPAEELELPPAEDFFTTFVMELRGLGTHPVSTQEALDITRVCLLARQAADTGHWVDL